MKLNTLRTPFFFQGIISIKHLLGVFSVCFFFVPFALSAQTNYSKLNIVSPNAASLGKFVDIPVNYHTGIPQVNVPLYTVREGSLELPVSLSYHAGGVKVADPASWVGTGWALNAGGVISRSVRGVPDEAINSHLGRRGHFSNYGYSSYYTERNSGDAWSMAYNDNDVQVGAFDGEPDLFFFNFNGHSGKFYFNDDRTPVLVSANEDLKIDYFYGLPVNSATFLDKNIQGFCITTGDGTKYFFGKTTAVDPVQGVYPVEISVPYDLSNGLSSDRVVSSWFLNKVESADKASIIDLFYEGESFSTYSWAYFPIAGTFSSTNNGYSLTKLFISGVRLSKIAFSQGTVLFSTSPTPRLDLAKGSLSGASEVELPNTEAKALKEITISNQLKMLKKISFYTSYFSDNPNGSTPGNTNLYLTTDIKRLKLDSVLEIGANGQALKPYKFNYYSDYLRRRLSFDIDHWGFYNSAYNNTILPTLTRNTYEILNSKAANRESSWPAMQNGALNKITYPTGGTVDFEFEANVAKIDAIRYNLEYVNSYWVGFNGSYTQEWTNVEFTGNDKYEFTFSNTACFNPASVDCYASYTMYAADGSSVASGYVVAGATTKFPKTIPPGVYRISMFRESPYSGTGATLTISKFKPSAILDPIVGGLRIKKITKSGADITSPQVVENYTYEENGRSSGYLYERPYYIAPLRSDLIAKLGMVAVEDSNSPNIFPEGCVYFPGQTEVPTVISPISTIPMSNVQGNHVGYASVRVDQSLNGYSVYKYNTPNLMELSVKDVAVRNFVTGVCDPSSPSFPTVPLPFEFERGELKAEYHFDAGNQLLKTAYYKYSFDSTKVYTPAIIVKSVLNLGRTFAEYQLRGYWKKYVVRNQVLLDRQTFKEIEETDTTFFNSPFHRSVTRKTIDQSTGGSLVSNFKYAFDYRLPATAAVSDGWSAYMTDCNTCHTEYINRITAPTATTGSKKVDFHRYRMCLAIARKNYVNYRRLNFTDPGNNVNTVHLNYLANADSEFKPILEMQNQFINSQVEVTSYRNGKLARGVYNRFSFENVLPNVYLSEVKQFNLADPAPYLPTGNTNSSIVKDPRYESEFLYRNLNGNTIEQQKSYGSKDVILWAYKNKYPVAEIKNADYPAIEALLGGATAVTSFRNSNPTDAQLKTFLAPIKTSFPNAQMITYTYDPLIGVTSVTDAKGMTSYYEYDEFQRLKYTKDQYGNVIKHFDYHYKL